MKSTTPQNLKGFRDFLPAEKAARDYVMSSIAKTYQTFGFSPLETPTLEYAELLMGKYGSEADKLVYSFEDNGGRQVAMRYDQTVPTARVLTQYQNDIPKYFRRFQMQNVFRADKPQKGRFREFTQCDIDIFNSTDSIADAEILACTYAAFTNLGFKNVQLKVNDRQVLISTLKEFATTEVDVFSIIQSIDKLDKLPPEKVASELVDKGLLQQNATAVLEAINAAEQSESLKNILNLAESLGVPTTSLVFTPTLARGLDYYTGMIFEVIVPEYPVGSCGGGGRYDNLISQLGGPDIPAVGMAIGFDRVVEAASELGLLPENLGASARVLVSVFSEELAQESAKIAAQLRAAGIATELYPDASDKLGKQFKLADQKGIPFVVIVGEEEVASKMLALKDMKTGEQQILSLEQAVTLLKN